MKFKEGDIIVDRVDRCKLKILTAVDGKYSLEIIHPGLIGLYVAGIFMGREAQYWDEDCELDEDYMVMEILKKYEL